TNVKRAGLEGLARFRFLYAQGGVFGELQAELPGEGGRHMEHRDDRAGEILAEARHEAHERGGSTGGGGQDDDREMPVAAGGKRGLARDRLMAMGGHG